MNGKDDIVVEVMDGFSSEATWSLGQDWSSVLHQYGLSFIRLCISLLYGIYLRFTFMNVVKFLLTYVPTTIYLCTLIKHIHVTSRERIKQNQIEMEDIQLQIKIINTKSSVREVNFTERREELQQTVKRLCRVRTRVRNLITTDNALRTAFQNFTKCDTEQEIHTDSTSSEDVQLIIEFLKKLKCDPVVIPERQTEKMDCGEHVPADTSSKEYNAYPAMRQDCQVKIVKVTNVYKVAYLKHFIRQKCLRRASKQAMMKKKMENIKKLLEDWQEKLNKVINNELTILSIDTNPLDVASCEARGDYSKVDESSDSDSDLRNNINDVYHDEYNNLCCARNPYEPCAYSYEYIPESGEASELKQEYYEDMKYPDKMQYEYRAKMLSITEETSSQVEFEEIKSEADEGPECTDLVAI